MTTANSERQARHGEVVGLLKEGGENSASRGAPRKAFKGGAVAKKKPSHAAATDTPRATSSLHGKPTDRTKGAEGDDLAARGKKDEAGRLANEDRRARDREQTTRPAPDRPARPACSDASRRSLSLRRAIWQRRLGQRRVASQWMGVYRGAAARCELPRWRDRRELLDLIQGRARTPAQVRSLLARLSGRASAFVRRRLLRRAVRPTMAAALADSVSWKVVDATLAAEPDSTKRLAMLRRVCKANPISVGCPVRLVVALLAAGKNDEALTLARRARADGLATPALLQQLGDLLAAAGRAADARRAYSEIVEFSPDDPAARLLLGDIYLRHAWYEEAYRQYRTVTGPGAAEPSTLLRLAAAAAGAGRVDEALRLERRVMAADGEPGPADPRRWARLWSAARMARLMLSTRAASSESMRQSMDRGLRRLQVMDSPGTLLLLTWEDLQARLTLTSGAGATPLNAGAAGLYAVTLRPGQRPAAVVSRAGGPARAVRYKLAVIRWDGKKLRVSNLEGTLDTHLKSQKVATLKNHARAPAAVPLRPVQVRRP